MKRPKLDPAVVKAVGDELRVNGERSGADLASKLGRPRPVIDRALGELLSLALVAFDARTDCYRWLVHEPNLDTQK